ncbi:MAG: hypothetical protein AB1405_02050 [Bdellovibrionota bacterium]
MTAPVHELTRALAPELGEGWRAEIREDYAHGATLRGPERDELFVHEASWPPSSRGRVEISALWPRYWQPKGNGQGQRIDPRPTREKDWLKITVALARGPAVIAKEIQRRLLPEYRKWMPEALRLYRDTRDAALTQAETLQDLADIAGARLEKFSGDRPDRFFIRAQDRYWAEIRYSCGKVEFHRLNVDPHVAREILEVLVKEYGKEEIEAKQSNG